MDFNNTKSGKVAFARALGLLESREVAFLRGLSELRNQLVHDIRNVDFSLTAYFATLNESQRKKFKSEFGSSLCATEGGDKRYLAYLADRPAFVVLFSAYHCLTVLHLNMEEQQRKLLVEALMKASQNDS